MYCDGELAPFHRNRVFRAESSSKVNLGESLKPLWNIDFMFFGNFSNSKKMSELEVLSYKLTYFLLQ